MMCTHRFNSKIILVDIIKFIIKPTAELTLKFTVKRNSFFLFSVLLIFSSCSGSFNNTINFNPTEPLRLAILPFVQVDSEGNFEKSESNVFLIDHIPGVSKKVEKTPTEILQDLVSKEISLSNFELIPQALTTSHLIHRNFSDDQSIDLNKIYNSTASELCAVLACDAVLYGKLSKWDRSYYGIQSTISVGYDLKISRASDNRDIFESQVDDTKSYGLTKGPTGYSSIVLEPIKGLDSSNITKLALENVSKSIQPLITSRENLELAPIIIAAAHSASNNEVLRTEPLAVLAYGSANVNAYFSIGNIIKNIPMKEVNTGHYVGYYLPELSDSFNSETIKVYFENDKGRQISIEVSSNNLSLQ